MYDESSDRLLFLLPKEEIMVSTTRKEYSACYGSIIHLGILLGLEALKHAVD